MMLRGFLSEGLLHDANDWSDRCAWHPGGQTAHAGILHAEPAPVRSMMQDGVINDSTGSGRTLASGPPTARPEQVFSGSGMLVRAIGAVPLDESGPSVFHSAWAGTLMSHLMLARPEALPTVDHLARDGATVRGVVPSDFDLVTIRYRDTIRYRTLS